MGKRKGAECGKRHIGGNYTRKISLSIKCEQIYLPGRIIFRESNGIAIHVYRMPLVGIPFPFKVQHPGVFNLRFEHSLPSFRLFHKGGIVPLVPPSRFVLTGKGLTVAPSVDIDSLDEALVGSLSLFFGGQSFHQCLECHHRAVRADGVDGNYLLLEEQELADRCLDSIEAVSAGREFFVVSKNEFWFHCGYLLAEKYFKVVFFIKPLLERFGSHRIVFLLVLPNDCGWWESLSVVVHKLETAGNQGKIGFHNNSSVKVVVLCTLNITLYQEIVNSIY